MSDDPVFVDAEEQSQRLEGLSFKDIVLNQLTRLTGLGSVEFQGGYWEHKPISIGGSAMLSKRWVQDSRAQYISAVDMLHDLLLPVFDDEMMKESENHEAEISKLIETQAGNNEDYMNKKRLLKRKLFQKLNLLLNRLGYLEAKTMRDE